MPATVTLSTTTFAYPAGQDDRTVHLASVSGLVVGTRLFVDRELMTVSGFPQSSNSGAASVNVLRGVDGTSATPHTSGSTVYIGRADQFFSTDPRGLPPSEVLVSPYINVLDGRIWFAQGDTLPKGNANRFWMQQTTTYAADDLGVRTMTQTPTSST